MFKLSVLFMKKWLWGTVCFKTIAPVLLTIYTSVGAYFEEQMYML